jgi:hypothetical protein
VADDRQFLVRWKPGEITPHASSEKQAKQIAAEYLLVAGRMEVREITGEYRERKEEEDEKETGSG